MGITQKDIARDLGIAYITVNRAFNGSGYVSETSKKRVLDYARERGYVPHRASQVLVRNKVRTIAVFSASEPAFFWDDIGKGVLSAGESLKPFNYEARYRRIPDFDTERYCEVLQEEIKRGINAAAFVNQRIFDMKRIFALAEKAGVPYLMYNVDAPETRRLCYVGSDYRAGGRLAANFIGKSLTMKDRGRALAIGFIQEHTEDAPKPDINSERLEGFLAVMGERYPQFSLKVEYAAAALTGPAADAQVEKILRDYEGRIDAVYFTPAFITAFHRGLKKFDYSKTITVQHDIDASTLVCLREDILTAAVFQDPILQGYAAVRELERILELKITERQKNIDVLPLLIFKENTGFLTNRPFLLNER